MIARSDQCRPVGSLASATVATTWKVPERPGTAEPCRLVATIALGASGQASACVQSSAPGTSGSTLMGDSPLPLAPSDTEIGALECVLLGLEAIVKSHTQYLPPPRQ